MLLPRFAHFCAVSRLKMELKNKMQQLTLNLALQPTFCSRESKSLRPADSSGGVWLVAQRTFKKEKDSCCIRVPRAEQTFEKFYSLITTRAVGVSHLQSTTCSSTVSDTVCSCTLTAWLLTGPIERIWTLSNSFIAMLLNEANQPKTRGAGASGLTDWPWLPALASWKLPFPCCQS